MLELFETPLTVLHIFVCLFLILVVLIQPGKSGGLGAALGGAGAQQVFGGRGAGNFLSRATWICASTFFVTSMVLAYISSSADDSLEGRSTTGESIKATPPGKDEAVATAAATSAVPDEPTPAPADPGAIPGQSEVEQPSEEPAEVIDPATAPPSSSVPAATSSVALPALGGLKPALLSTAAPVAPKLPVAPLAPVKPAPTPNVASPALVPAPAKPATPPPAFSAPLPNKSVPPALPLKPAPVPPAASH